MEPSPDIIPISDFRRDAAGIIGRTVASGRPVYVTQHGRLTAVLVSRLAYEGLLQRLAVLTAVPGGGAVAAATAEATTGDSVGSKGAAIADRDGAPWPVGRPVRAVETRFGWVDPETADFLAVDGFGCGPAEGESEPAEGGGGPAPDEALAAQ